MLIVYDFKIPIEKGSASAISDSNQSEDACENIFLSGIDKVLKGFIIKQNSSGADDLIFNARIIKKSLDLRQKEPKIVFKALIKITQGLNPEKPSLKDEVISEDNRSRFKGVSESLSETENSVLKYLTENNIKAKIASDEDIDAEASLNSAFIYPKNDIDKRNNIRKKNNHPKVIIAGMGPAGIFAAVTLINNGIKPIIIEKGKRVEDRINDVKELFNKGKFNEKSNVVFGEGGAGTFSDGKLTTRKNDPLVSYVLNFLVKMGAKPDILMENRPHIGSDGLIYILKNIRNYLLENGTEIFFEEELLDIIPEEKQEKERFIDSIATDKRFIKVDFLINATGANNYAIYEMFDKKEIFMERKAFAVGFRIEHRRDFINRLFLKREINGKYDLHNMFKSIYYNIGSKDFGGYSFCMCPGGVVINSSSEPGHLCVNGMSYSKRDYANSNSAIVVPIRPEMLDKIGSLDKGRYSSNRGGVIFRQDLEKIAYSAGGGNFSAPFQSTAEYIEDAAYAIKEIMEIKGKYFKSDAFLHSGGKNLNLPEPSYKPSVKYYNLFNILPGFINISLAGSLMEFESKYSGFIGNSILTGVETGTSSAVRIKRGLDFESVSLKGLYPCGEGSGYSGGIVTSAMDGIKCAKAIAEKYKNKYL